MKKLKKILAVVFVVLVLFASVVVPPASAGTLEEDCQFTSVSCVFHWIIKNTMWDYWYIL
ncbi:MAG: hypothetical protein V1668_03295 [Patescibacteria group bacterium]